MKKFLFLSFLFITANSFAAELHTFAEIKSAVITGKVIHIAIDFTKCETAQKKSALSHVGVFTPTSIQVINSQILTSFTHFTMNNINYPNTPVNEFVRYAISDDNNLVLSYQALDARNYSILIDKMFYTCKLDLGFKVYD